MALFKRGLNDEERLRTKLESYGCTVQKDVTYDHRFKLDFVVINFPENPRFYSLGVQVTGKPDEVEKMEEFLAVQQANHVTSKAMYLELEPNVNLEEGGAFSALAAMLAFQFDRQYSQVRLIAVRILSDLNFVFYDLEERIRQLRQRLREEAAAKPSAIPTSPAAPAAKSAQEVDGMVTNYLRDKGFGFIEADEQGKFYFHIKSVIDERLREYLQAVPAGGIPAAPNCPICFTSVGRTRPDALYPEARNVRLR